MGRSGNDEAGPDALRAEVRKGEDREQDTSPGRTSMMKDKTAMLKRELPAHGRQDSKNPGRGDPGLQTSSLFLRS
jgi:hypothetical protein